MAKAQKEAPLKSAWGGVRIYVRHIDGCKRRGDDNSICKCSWWLYSNRKGGEVKRRSLTTPSRAEALKLANEELDGFNPEIAASRAKKAAVKLTSKTPMEAVNLWLDRTAARFGKETSTWTQYRATFGWIHEDGTTRGNMLRYIEAYNRRHHDAPITTIQDITPLILQQWHDSWKHSATTARQKWGVVRSFFNYLHQLGVLTSNPAIAIKAVPDKGEFRNVPFTDAQYQAILQHARVSVDDHVKDGERQVFCRRMTAYMECLRWTGMDLVDAIKLQPARQIDDRNVLTYTRTKTKITAKIPLEPWIADVLRKVPAVPDSEPGMPFRYQSNLIVSDVRIWSRRITKLFGLAGIDRVCLTLKDGTRVEKKPNAKSFRHTFAVDCLSRLRLRVELVARMLGHVDATMVQKHYAPWTEERDDLLIEEVFEARQAYGRRKLQSKDKEKDRRMAVQ
jgi:integrase